MPPANPNDEVLLEDSLRRVLQGEVAAYELRSHTIRVYDLTMESPAALELEEFQIHMFKEPVTSLSMLEEAECTARSAAMKFRGLAVGIDLSDLGYDEGETVDGLFFQDALDDDHIVDPVFIGGLPTMQGSNP